MKLKPTNAHKCATVFYTHRIPATCFSHSFVRHQGCALQRMGTSKCYRRFCVIAQLLLHWFLSVCSVHRCESIKIQWFYLLKLDLFKIYYKYKVFFINLPAAKLMHDTGYLAITYWESVHNYLGTSEGNVLNVHRSDGFGILIQLSSCGRRLLRTRWQLNFDSGRSWPDNWPWWTGRSRSTIWPFLL